MRNNILAIRKINKFIRPALTMFGLLSLTAVSLSAETLFREAESFDLPDLISDVTSAETFSPAGGRSIFEGFLGVGGIDVIRFELPPGVTLSGVFARALDVNGIVGLSVLENGALVMNGQMAATALHSNLVTTPIVGPRSLEVRFNHIFSSGAANVTYTIELRTDFNVTIDENAVGDLPFTEQGAPVLVPKQLRSQVLGRLGPGAPGADTFGVAVPSASSQRLDRVRIVDAVHSNGDFGCELFLYDNLSFFDSLPLSSNTVGFTIPLPPAGLGDILYIRAAQDQGGDCVNLRYTLEIVSHIDVRFAEEFFGDLSSLEDPFGVTLVPGRWMIAGQVGPEEGSDAYTLHILSGDRVEAVFSHRQRRHGRLGGPQFVSDNSQLTIGAEDTRRTNLLSAPLTQSGTALGIFKPDLPMGVLEYDLEVWVARELFVDGFESGSTSAWSSTSD